MNATSDTRLTRVEEKVEAAREEPQPAPDAALVELGKVSDTKGGWLGYKPDSGAGFTTY
ncbi:MAG: hypothetical protein WBW93_04110 [Steroidobacteraceae bacterium]